MPADHQSRPLISTTQLMSSALAAVTAAVVGSRLGIAGTLIGAAAGSVIGTAGTAMYAHWLDRTATRVRTVVRLPSARRHTSVGSTDVVASTDRATPVQPRYAAAGQPTWRTVVLAAAATFAVAIGSITAFEAISGEPVSTLTGGDAGAGTTLGRVVESDPVVPVELGPTPTPTGTPTTSPTTTPTTTPTESPTTPPPTTEPTTPPPTTPPPTTPTPPPTDPVP